MSDQKSHLLLGEWLLTMGYPKDKFPSEDQLKKVCRGSLFRCFWKDVVKSVKPKQEVAFIKENIFVKSIRYYEGIENSSKAKLGQVLPPEPLLLWKQFDDNETTIRSLKKTSELSDSSLDEKIVKLKTKSSRVNQLKKSSENLQREVHLMKETIHQINVDIHQSKTLSGIITSVPCFKRYMTLKNKQNDEIDLLADFLQFGMKKSETDSSLDTIKIDKQDTKAINNYESLFSIPLEEIDNIEVEKLLENVDLSTLYNNLLKRREDMNGNILGDKLIEEELSVVEDNAQLKNILPWKESLAQLNLMHTNIIIAAIQNKTNYKKVVEKFQSVLKSNILPAKVSQHVLDAVKMKCKYIELVAYTDSFKEDITNISCPSGLFIGNINQKSDLCTDYGQSIVNIRDDILALHTFHKSKQILVHGNISKLAESINMIKEIRRSVINTLGHGNLCAIDKNESLNLSLYHPNSTMKSVINKNLNNLIDAKHIFCETNANRQTKQDINDISKILLNEIKSFKKFDLHRNRKIVLESGEKLWIDETIHHALINESEIQQKLFKVLNPSISIPGIINTFWNLLQWKKSLNNLSLSIDKNNLSTLPTRDDLTILGDEKDDPILDNLLKNSKRCLQPLHVIDSTINGLTKSISFFKTFEAKKYICPERLVDGRTFTETENEIKQILSEELYWK